MRTSSRTNTPDFHKSIQIEKKILYKIKLAGILTSFETFNKTKSKIFFSFCFLPFFIKTPKNLI